MAIKCKDLVRLYRSPIGDNVLALSGINLDIDEGDFISIIGPSGAGKTTLLNLISGSDIPTIGSIKILGKTLHKLSPLHKKQFLRKNIGFVKQNPNEILSLDLTALENITYAANFRNYITSIMEIENLLNLVDLKEKEQIKTRFLSMGEKIRLTIAIALIHEPKILLLDEPTGLLDSSTMYQVLTVLKKINKQGVTIISATHDTRFFYSTESIYLLINGRIASIQRMKYNEEKVKISLSSLVDKAGFVQIPLMVREKLQITDTVLFSLSDNNKEAIMKNPFRSSKNRVLNLTEVIKAMEIVLPPPDPIQIQVNIKKYPKDFCVLHDIRLTANSGEFMIVMGPSGSGKSSLLGIVSGELGDFIGEREIRRHLKHVSSSVNTTTDIILIPHDPFLHPDYTVWTNLLVVLKNRTQESIIALKVLLKYFNLENRINAYPHQLSGGEYQRVIIILGILLAPPILIIDEPTTHLNIELRNRMMNILETVVMKRQIGVIMSTHDYNCLREGHILVKIQNGTILKKIKLNSDVIKKEKETFLHLIQNKGEDIKI